VIDITTLASAATNFETSISKTGQIQQTSASDLSGHEYWFILVHS
jgi:hypothetical protein